MFYLNKGFSKMIKFSKIFGLLMVLILFSCDQDVTGNGDNCTADPVGVWGGITRTIEYVEDCSSHCVDYDTAYQDYYGYCSEVITLLPPGNEELLCTSKPIVFYQNLDCYNYIA